MKSKKIELTIDLGDLTNFTANSNRITCLAKCPNCSIKIKCAYYSTWKNSNFCKHLVACVKKNVGKSPDQTNKIEIERAKNSDSINSIVSAAVETTTQQVSTR